MQESYHTLRFRFRQLTAQELSTMVTNKLTPIVFVLNNSGYTIEKFIRGMHRQYNNVANW
jgi:pyruvate decarboxylase